MVMRVPVKTKSKKISVQHVHIDEAKSSIKYCMQNFISDL